MSRRLMIVLSGGLLAAVTLGSLLIAPSGSANRLRPIPAYAHLVYSDRTAAGFLSSFPMLGKTAEDISAAEVLRSNVWKKSFHCLENRPLAVATVPFGGRAQRDTWIAVSELSGLQALMFRWKLLLFPPAGMTPSRGYAAWSIWRLEDDSLPSWMRIRLALTEGLLICSISGDSHDIYKLLDTADGRAVSLANRRTPR